MRLRATAGRYAGLVRDYSYSAGVSALGAGTAERVRAEDLSPPVPPEIAPAPAVPALQEPTPPASSSGHRKKR